MEYYRKEDILLRSPTRPIDPAKTEVWRTHNNRWVPYAGEVEFVQHLPPVDVVLEFGADPLKQR